MRAVVNVLIAGIGGGSLGTEIAKSLSLAGNYNIIGCDVSPLAFGHYAQLCNKTYVIPKDGYIDHLLEIARREQVQIVVPGAEQPTNLIAAAHARFYGLGIYLAMNSIDVIARVSDKNRCFKELQQLGIRTPRTTSLTKHTKFTEVPVPCIIKPGTDSGGSSFVFFARNPNEVELYAVYLTNNGKRPIAQEYITHGFGEFTVGVLSDPAGAHIGTIALKREFPTKLSIHNRGEDFLISSGISQGHIGEYSDICETAREIAIKIGSKGPLNIQGRVDSNGNFLPFEINPRFSASTYLRALAGFNEIDIFIRLLIGGSDPVSFSCRPGWYLRSLTEIVVADGKLQS